MAAVSNIGFSLLRAEVHEPFGPPPDGVDVVWRCEARSYSYIIDADREEYGTTEPRLELRWQPVERRTPKGAWAGGKLVIFSHARRFFAATKQDALRDLRARRKRQLKILANQARCAEFELALVEKALQVTE